MSRTITIIGLWLLFAQVSTGCSEASEGPASTPVGAQESAPTGDQSGDNSSPIAAFDRLRFKGTATFELKSMSIGYKLEDENDIELARYKLSSSGAWKITGADDRVIGYIAGDADKFEVRDAEKVALFHWQRQADGDYKLEDGEETLLYKIKRRDYGYKIVTADEVEFAKIKTRAGKTSIRGVDGTTRLSSKDPITTAAMTPFAFEQIALPLRAGLSLALMSQ